MTYNEIKNNLDKWSKESNGSYSIVTTIEIKSPNMNIRVDGCSVEDAFSKVETLCTVRHEEKAKEANTASVPTFPDPVPQIVPSTLPTTAPITSPDFLQEATKLLNGRTLVRVHNNTQPLAIDEELVTISGTNFVVKKS